MSRLTIDVSAQQHQALKAMAALQGQTIKDYVLERLFPPANGDDGPARALAELQALLAQRLAQAQRDGVSDQSMGEVAEAELGSGQSV